MSAPLIRSAMRPIYYGYNTGTNNTTGGGLSPLLTEVLDKYNAGTGLVYTFPKKMWVKVTARATILTLAASSNGLLYFVESGGSAMPINYRDIQAVSVSGETFTLGTYFVHQFNPGNAISMAVITTVGNARLYGSTDPGQHCSLLIEEFVP